MIFADTHTHLYLEQFNEDIDIVVENAIKNSVELLFLPNIDSNSILPLLELSKKYPNNCFPLLALHPTDVKDDYKKEILILEQYLKKEIFYGIGETGIDLYWDKTYLKQQIESFEIHCQWSIEHNLPLIIHTRKSHNETIEVLNNYKTKNLKGIFHCFSGSYEQAKEIVNRGFYLGIGGTSTYKNSKLDEVLIKIGIENILLETDSPFLPPVPHRGERNESKYIRIIAEKIAEIFNLPLEKIAEITTYNTKKLFKLEP